MATYRTLMLLCFLAAPAIGAWQGGLNVRFDITVVGIGVTAFIELPQSNTTALEKSWVQVTRPEGPAGLASLVLWCPPTDYTVCVLIDDTGYIAGLQVALDIEKVTGNIYDMRTQGFTYWTTNMNGETKNYWTTQQYYISPETLATDPAARIAARDPNLMLQDHSIYVSGLNGELYAISTNTSDIAHNSDFTEQACIPGMGDHYYYKMTPELSCTEDNLLPWFPLVHSDQLIGIGMVTYGRHVVSEGATDWFETPTRGVIMAIVPRGPQCMYDMADSPGVITMHTYFIKHPYEVTC
ncbi:unnamed protein product [Spodoptera littoralis]|uniref:Uncharacterized protein n=2 Tax=Spodoptera TaxID=7106 RepID=A0A9P0N2K9_SPOLI|nr:uncharacterized protein LOC111350240 [Spodoptera litura]CAB3508047.1 unnamed protein product [Spodoptera littoralis]CAH1637596.1 unnamed protein product [Spodoptera littoralis]